MERKNVTGEENKYFNPFENINCLSKLFFCWTVPTFIKGYKNKLVESDLNGYLEEHDTGELGSKLENAWEQEKVKNKPSLSRAIWKVFGGEICCYGLLLFIIEFGAKLAHPLLLGKLMQYYTENQKAISKGEVFIYASLIILISFANVLFGHNYMMGTQHLGMKIRVACSSLIYRKTLMLSNSSTSSLGKTINILANDLGRFDNIFLSFHNIWAAPLQIVVVTCLLYFTAGIYSLTGIGFFVLFIPVQVFLGKKLYKYRLKTAVRTDDRVRVTNEIINGIQVIKMHTWENSFGKLVERTRDLEMKQIEGASMVRAINASVSMFLNRSALYFAVLAYTLTGNILQAHYVFVVTSFYNVLRQPLVFHIPHAFSSFAESAISIKRIENFLMEGEIESNSIKVDSNMKSVGIFLHDVSVKWDLTGEEVLTNINLNARTSELMAIIGPVGSGKSTLFKAILQELVITKGVLDICGTTSYASQEPWLFDGTIRENIIFGEEMNQERYQEVCRVCQLEKDFSLLPYRDETLIGGRGITLSGGQKSRINLARAIYRNVDIYLLDDPFSAVDTNVGKKLYNSCILQFLKGKCVLFITHQLQYLINLDKICLMRNGTVESCETFNQFVTTHKDIVCTLKSQEEDCKVEEGIFSIDLNSIKNKTEAQEHIYNGNVNKRVYSKYIRAGGGYFLFFLIIIMFFSAQFLASSGDYFLTYWADLEEFHLNKTTDKVNTDRNIFMNQKNCIYLYSSLMCFLFIMTILRSMSFMKACMKASKRLCHQMSASILNTNMNFFYNNPPGRIINRFSKDLGIVDEVFPLVILETFQALFSVVSIITLISIVNPWILIPSVVILSIFYWLKKFFLSSSQYLKRLEAAARSPVFSHLSDSMHGLTTIRALSAQDYLNRQFEIKQNMHNSTFYLFMGCNRAFGFWLDFLCVVYVGVVIMSLLLMLDETTGGNVGLAITQSLALTGMFQFGIRQWSEMENQMTVVERVVEYTELKPESSANEISNKFADWPKSGGIEFNNVYLKYKSNEPYVLCNINVSIKHNKNIGIVGRTGAGKSSLVTALFRLVEIEGSILIDGIDSKTLPLSLLRSKISIIPQEPTLFHGTLRMNLDPLDEFKDDELWAALKEVELNHIVHELPGGLYTNVFEGGCNFSVGQKQLLCITRALIRNNKILILDEATSSVDQNTDFIIQNTIRKKFSQCTVLKIAHRLQTVMDSDKVMVLDAGSLVEFDHPYKLLQNKNSVFYDLLTHSENSDLLNMMKIAEEHYKATYNF